MILRFEGSMITVLTTVCWFASVAAAGAEFGAAASRPAGDSIAPLPQPIASFGAAVDGNWLYILGGHIGEQHHHSKANLSSLFMRLNLFDRASWELLPGGMGLQSVGLAAHDGKLYRVGGMRALNDPGQAEDLHSVDQVARFDPMAKQWTALPALPEPRSSHDAIVYEGQLYVAGGWTLSGASDEAKWIKNAYMLDLRAAEPKWEALPQQPFERRAVAVAAVPGRLYVIGGITPDGRPSSEVDLLDLDAKQWSKGPPLPGNGFGVSAVTVGQRLHASGLDGKLHRLNQNGKVWEEVNTLSFPRIFHRLVAADESTLLAVGGAGKGGHLRIIEELALGADRSAPDIRTWTLPWPGPARNRQGVFLNQTELTFFGGNNSLEQHDFEPENFVDEALSFNIGSLGIERRERFPVRRQSMVTAVVHDSSRPIGYALGGFGHDGEAARSFDDIFRFDFKEKRWGRLDCRLPAPLTQFGLVTHGSELWLLGGLDYDPRREKDDRFRHSSRIWVWNTFDDAGAFNLVEQQLKQPRRAFGCATLGDRLYLVGGMRENFKLVESCDVFNVVTRTWESIPSPRASRISPELVALDGRLYLIGGSSPDADNEIVPNESVEVYDPSSRRWTVLIEKLAIPSKHVRAFAVHGQLLLASTHAQDNVLRILMLRPGVRPPPEISQAR